MFWFWKEFLGPGDIFLKFSFGLATKEAFGRDDLDGFFHFLGFWLS